MKVKTSKGFTLAELLIVMAIITVLAAIAIPTFGKQLETAREANDVEAIRAAASEAFSEVFTSYVTAASPVAANTAYYSTAYTVKFAQHTANFQYMTPVIEIGGASKKVTNTPSLGDGVALPATANVVFKFTVDADGNLQLADVMGGASTAIAASVSSTEPTGFTTMVTP